LQDDVTQTTVNSQRDKHIEKFILEALDENKNAYFLDPVLSNIRIKSQQGLFSLTIDKKKKFIDSVYSKFIENYLRKYQRSKCSNLKIKTHIDNDFNEKQHHKKLVDDLILYYKQEKLLDLGIFQKYLETLEIEYDQFLTNSEDKLNSADKEGSAKEMNQYFQTVNSNLLNNPKSLKKDNLLELIIPKENKQKVKEQLINFGVDATSIYPDIQGTIDFIKNKYK